MSAEVGIESTLAGWARILFSEARAAALTWTIISPELSPPSVVRNAGKPDKAGLMSFSILRSEIPPSSETTIPRRSRAKAIGSPWKLPQLRIFSRSAKMRGLSVAEFTSIARVLRTYAMASRTAPWTWGMHRIEYASWTLGHVLCDSAM